MTWQPIEMAPKDGTRVILYVPLHHERWKVVTGFWFEDEETMTGYWEMSKSNHFNYQPTHWMPLPTTPEA